MHPWGKSASGRGVGGAGGCQRGWSEVRAVDGGRQIKRWGEGGEASCRAGWAIKTALTLEPVKMRSRCGFPAKGHCLTYVLHGSSGGYVRTDFRSVGLDSGKSVQR